jgi:hypothetical protein
VENDPLAEHSVLGQVTRSVAAPWVLAIGLVGSLVAIGMASRRSLGSIGVASVVVAWLQAVAYAIVIPDGRPLIAAAHLPVLLLGKPFGWPPGVTISSQVSWPMLNQVFLMLLGALWASTAIIFRRRAVGSCIACGRRPATVCWTKPTNAARWGRWAVYAAITPPIVYAITRLAWAAGIPLGVSKEFMTEQTAESPEIFMAGAAMAFLALGGAVLTLGLTQRWGEIYPGWVPGLRGKPVRARAAIIPAAAVAFLMTSSGVGWIRAAVLDYFPEGAMGKDFGTVGPGILLPVWGLALGAATYAYYLRRRSTCKSCGLS